MIGNDLVRYHNYIHGPVHYTDSLETFPLTTWGLSTRPFEGSAADPMASATDPFRGHMFINGCVSATGWLDDNGNCRKLATAPITAYCGRVSVCGDHMKGALHMSHQVLTRHHELSSYDLRNAEVDFSLDKDTFKTIICDDQQPLTRLLYITPTNIKPGCVATLRIVVPMDSPHSSVKLALHPDLVWLTPRPIMVIRGIEAIISFESYGSRTSEVVCSHRERCIEVCERWGSCSLTGVSGFESFEGSEKDIFKEWKAGDGSLSGSPLSGFGDALSGCNLPIDFIPWKSDCGRSYSYDLSGSLSARYMFDFSDYYDGDGGTRLWNISKTLNRITNEYDPPEWYYSGNQANMFNINISPGELIGYPQSPLPNIKIYKGDYKTIDSEPLSGDLIYNSTSDIDPEHPWVYNFLGSPNYSVKFTRTGGQQYLVVLECDSLDPRSVGEITTQCPFYYIAYRYIPKLN